MVHVTMASFCVGHEERDGRKNKINKTLKSMAESPLENKRMLIKGSNLN